MNLKFFNLFNRIDRVSSVRHSSNSILMLLSSVLIAIAWVGTYRYKYNIGLFNTQCINIWAFSLWVVTGYITLNMIFYIKSRVRYVALHFPLSWLLYFAGLLLFEYIGYYLLNIHEQSALPSDALIFGLIHGSPALHAYYVSYPLLITAVYRGVISGKVFINTQLAFVKFGVVNRRFKTWP